MIEPRELLDEHLDGLLPDAERARVERAVQTDPELRAELERAREFAGMLGSLAEPVALAHTARRPRGTLVALVLATAAAAALLVWLGSPVVDPLVQELDRDWRTFGQRLAQMALERREDRAPRIGLSDLDVPPAKAFGRVYGAALDHMGVDLDDATRVQAERLVRDHFTAMRSMPGGVVGEWKRSQSALGVYRSLREGAGRAAADAFYDVFRPGLVDSATVFRVQGGHESLVRVLRGRREYLADYEEACRTLERRYGSETLAVVMNRLAPDDARYSRRDAAQDGAAPDAVLSIRAALYGVAAEHGADRLYVSLQ